LIGEDLIVRAADDVEGASLPAYICIVDAMLCIKEIWRILKISIDDPVALYRKLDHFFGVTSSTF
jgi:hypothetical protein